MTLEALLDALREGAVEVWREGDCLRYRGASSRLTPPLLEAMKEHKAALLDLEHRSS